MKNKLSPDNLLLLLILLVAAILRFWNYTNIPYMHDELSALARTHYSTFYEEVYYGVAKYDTHPAGVQLFLYYWTKLFGENEMIVKLPFIICGLLSMVVAFKIAKLWFNSSVGLIIASFMAVMQYFITYSQIARPYISGVFFCLLMVWCWSNYFFNDNATKKNKWLIGYILSSAFCAYDHHFALLFTMVVGFTGIFFINKTNWKGYVLAGISIFVLYIPHIKIFMIQLGKGGLGGSDGWLGKPGADWLLTFLKYTFHYSYVMYALGFILLIISIYYNTKNLKPTQKFRIIAAVWFFLVFFIEYYYSLYVNPIIQFSTIIFVFPFLLMFIFSLFRELSTIMKTSIVSSILIIGIITLVITRKHYTVFYHQPYQEEITNTYKVLDKIGSEKKATIELLIPPYFKEHYFKKYNREFKSIYFNPFDEKIDYKAFRKFVNEQTTDYFIFGNPPLEYIQIIKEKYPYMMTKEEGFCYSYYCFSKQKPTTELHEKIIFTKKIDLSNGANKIDSTVEYGKPYTEKIKAISNSRNNIINITAQLSSNDSLANPTLVADIQQDGNSIYWNGADYNNFNNNIKGSDYVYLSKSFTDFDLRKYSLPKIKVYIWNRNKKNISIENFNVEIIKGNPLLYGLFEPID